VETMVGSVRFERPYFYCRACCKGYSPLDEALGLTPGHYQLDVHKAATNLAIETTYKEAQSKGSFAISLGSRWAASACIR
jgi:hypothetical protein